MPLSNPVIFVPGITATYLRDQYPLPPELVWSVMTKNYARATLHPNNLQYEAQEPARLVPDQLYEIAYEEIIEELRYNLRASEEDIVPVYPFGYDWRQPLNVIEGQLDAFIDEVIERTKLMRNYYAEDYQSAPKVNLVGHSMGGLIIAGYLEGNGAAKVDKVVSLASPFQGSFETVIKVTTGTANLGTEPPSSREREAARLTPALYHLIPSFRSGLEVGPGLPSNLFDPGIWQPSIIETIKEFIRLHGTVPRPPRREIARQAEELFKGLLDAARKHRRRLDRLKLDQVGMDQTDWLCVVGVDAVTRVKLQVVKVGGKPNFAFRSSDRMNNWTEGDDAERRLTGDGTVPFEGAVPKFLPYESLICVTPDDYGYWEVADRTTTALAGFHGILPNMNMLHRLIVRHFTGRPDRHGNTWGRPAPGVSPSAWNPPIVDLKPKNDKS